jgi:hypothetical protein
MVELLSETGFLQHGRCFSKDMGQMALDFLQIMTAEKVESL